MNEISFVELNFLAEAAEKFERYPALDTFRNLNETLIALKRHDEDIEVYRIDSKVGYFAGVRKIEGETK